MLIGKLSGEKLLITDRFLNEIKVEVRINAVSKFGGKNKIKLIVFCSCMQVKDKEIIYGKSKKVSP